MLFMYMRAQSCLTPGDPTDCILPRFSVSGIFQARILEWVAISFSSGSSCPRDLTHVSYIFCIGRWILYHWATWKTQNIHTVEYFIIIEMNEPQLHLSILVNPTSIILLYVYNSYNIPFV